MLEKCRRAFQIRRVSVIQRSIQVGWQLRVFFTENVFAPDNPVLRDALADTGPRKALVVLEDSLAQALPGTGTADRKLFFRPRAAGPPRPPAAVRLRRRTRPKIPPRSSAKSIRSSTATTLTGTRISSPSAAARCSTSPVLPPPPRIAACGMSAFPTTTLSQADSGVGVKNGLNAFGQKNFIGTFAPPFAVINDFNLLATLPPRDKRSGYVEAVKVACIRDAEFFDEIERDAEKLAAFEPDAMKQLIRRCAELHLDHIATSGDPFETGSARPLDFGHWAAHKLEQLSHFNISHGEAVAIGIALDVIYSRKIGLLDPASAARILNLLEKLGFKLFADELLNADNANLPAIVVRPRGIPRTSRRRTFHHACWRKSAAASKSTK